MYVHNSRLRGLDFIPMNEPEEGFECHHMTKEVVMFVPHWLHRCLPHSIKTGKNMDIINNLCYQWFEKNI